MRVRIFESFYEFFSFFFLSPRVLSFEVKREDRECNAVDRRVSTRNEAVTKWN